MDGQINPGETITMDIRLQNIVYTLVEDINLTLSSESNYISFLEPTKSYGSMKGGYYKTQYGAQYYSNNDNYKYGYTSEYYYSSLRYPYSGELDPSYGWTFTIDKDTPYDTIIPFNLEFTDKNGDTWTDSFNVTVVKPNVSIIYHANEISDSVSDTYTFNNGDGKINPGETISMDIRIQNKGTSKGMNIMSKLTTTSQYVSLPSNEKSYETINPGYYKHRRRDEFLVSIAGVTTNFLLALIASFIIKGMLYNMTDSFYAGIGGVLLDILVYVFGINIVLMVFNLLPVPPLDGFGILTQIFDLQKYDWYWKLYQNGFPILMVLIIFNVTDKIIGPVSGFFYNLLLFYSNDSGKNPRRLR